MTGLEAACVHFLSSLEAPGHIAHRDELERQRLESILRQRGKWRDVRVAIFGSAGSGLRVGEKSDVDLCIMLPRYADELNAARNKLRAAEDHLAAVEAAHPEAARLMGELGQAQRASRAAARDLDVQLKKLGRLEDKRAKKGGSTADTTLVEAAAAIEIGDVAAVTPSDQVVTEEVAADDVAAAAPDDVAVDGMDAIAETTAKVSSLRTELRAAEAKEREATAALAEDGGASEGGGGGAQLVKDARRHLEWAEAEGGKAKKIVYALAPVLTAAGYNNVVPVARARTPVVRSISPQGVSCDCVVNNGLATYNTGESAALTHACLPSPCVHSRS